MLDNCAVVANVSSQSLTVNTLLGCFLPRLDRAKARFFLAVSRRWSTLEGWAAAYSAANAMSMAYSETNIAIWRMKLSSAACTAKKSGVFTSVFSST